MDIQTTKIELAKLVLEIENPTLIEKIHEALTEERGDFWNRLSKQEKAEIELGISQLNKGEKIRVDDYFAKVS